jgi:hypothetical protein
MIAHLSLVSVKTTVNYRLESAGYSWAFKRGLILIGCINSRPKKFVPRTVNVQTSGEKLGLSLGILYFTICLVVHYGFAFIERRLSLLILFFIFYEVHQKCR